MEDTLELALLGGLRIARGGTPLTDLASHKGQALLCYLAATGRPHSRATLAGLLWPELPEDDARTNLRAVLAKLQKVVAPHLSITRETVGFNPALPYWLDIECFLDALRRAQAAPAPASTAALREAGELYRGDFLEGFYVRDAAAFEEWVLGERQYLRGLAVDALHRLAATCANQADYAGAVGALQRLLALEPWREEAHRQLMRLLTMSGQRSAALNQYEVMRRQLQAEIGVAPEAESQALYEQIRSGALADKVTRWPGDKVTVSRDNSALTFSPHLPVSLSPAQDSNEAPDLGSFYGRASELAALERWLLADRCRVVALVGMGGVGKTALAARLVETVAARFDHVIWRSLLNAPPLEDILRGWLQALSDQQISSLPNSLDERLALLLGYLHRSHCLLILDNVESILQDKERAGVYRAGFNDYGQLIQRVGQCRHQSCLLLTSRERPLELARLERESPLVRSLQLAGLANEAGQAILQEQGLAGEAASQAALIERYSGNPLALKLVAQTIQELFAGNIGAFLRDETPIFDDIRDVLDQQFARLSPLERELLTWLAIEREAASLDALEQNLVRPEPRRTILEAVRSLQRRSLLEQQGDGFTLQNVVMEYVTDRVVSQVAHELEIGELDLFARHALSRAQAREYVRQSQIRLILAPLSERIAARLGRATLLAKLRALPDALRARPELVASYAAGNLLNLLIHMGANLAGLDLSRLALWQASLRSVSASDINLTLTDLTGSTFSDTFASAFVVAFSADGETLAAGTNLGDVRLWQVATGQPIGRLSGHGHAIRGLAFSPDGRTLASGSLDQTIRLWDVETAHVCHVLRGHADAVFGVAFSPDGRTLASASTDRTVRLWDVQRGEQRRILEGHTDIVRTVAFSPDGATIVSAGYDRTIRLWNAESGQVEAVLAGHAQMVYAIAFSPTGALLASASGDRTVRVWNLSDHQIWHVLHHPHSVKTVAFSPTGALLASGAYGDAVRLWDIDTGQCLRMLSGPEQRVDSIAFSPNGEMLASASNDQAVRLWSVRTGQLHTTLYGYNNPIYAVALSHDGTTLASGGGDYAVRLWDVGTSHVRRLLEGHSGQVQSVAFSPTGAQVASASSDWTVRLWDAGGGHLLGTLHGHTNSVYAVAFGPDGTLLASASEDQTIRVWDIRSGETLQVLHDPMAVRSVVFHPGGATVLGASEDGAIRHWDIASGNCVGTLVGHESHVSSVALSPDGRTLVSGSNDRSVRVWDLISGTCRHILTGHANWINAVAFSPDEVTIASASVGGRARLWHSGTGQQLHTLHGHSARITSVAFSPNGRVVVSGAFDGIIKLWDVQTGNCLRTLRAVGPYAGMNIASATGLTEAQRSTLKALGAVEH